MDRPGLSDAERLALETDWLHRLALRLVHDVHTAEDVVQDTLLAALDRPHWARQGDGSLRAWLTGTVRNLARLGQRGAARRAERERVYGEGRPSEELAPDEIIERARGARRLMDAVLELDEPYRTAVLLSYGEGLDAPTIAARVDATPTAVRKRVSRGVQKLRGSLAGDDGAAPAWLLGVAGLGAPTLPSSAAVPAAASLGPLPLLAMTMKWIPVAAVTAVAGLGLWNFLQATTPTPDVALGRSVETQSVARHDASLGVVEPAGAGFNRERLAESATSEASDAPRAETAAAMSLLGQVVLADDGRGLEGATVHLSGPREGALPGEPDEEVLATTGRDGTFALALDAGARGDAATHGLWIQHPRAHDVHVSAARVAALGAARLLVHTVPLGDLTVLVLDETGEPAQGKRVSYSFRPKHGSEAQLWAFQRDFVGGESDASGRVVLAGLPVSTEIQIGFAGEFLRPARAVIDPVTLRAETTLRATPWGEVRATLRWDDGSPAAGVDVTWHGASPRHGSMSGYKRTSDADGLLVFDGLSEGEGRLLFRAKSYHAPVDGLSVRGEVQDLGVLTLSRPVELSGRVESDALAKSAEGLSVYAFRSGAPIAKGVLDGSMEFSLQVPAGPVALVVCRSLQWNPRLPFRGSFLGRQDAVAPATGVVVRCAGPGASMAGVVPSGGSTVTLSRFDEDTPTSFGVPIPRTEDLGRTPVEGDGRFMAPLEPAEDTLLLVESEDRGSAYVRLDGLGTGETIELGELEWTRTELEVLVVDAEGTPVPGAVVTARDRGAESTEETTDEKGVARFELDAGPYGVQVDAGDAGAMTWTLVHLTGPEKRTLSLDLAALLTGQIQSPDGPEADIAVRAQRMEPISNLILSATSKSDGAFAFKPASPGLYRYWVQGQLMGSVRLAPGERKELDLEVRGPSSTVEVRAGGERLTRLGALFVRAAGDDSAQWSTGSAASGGVFETVLPDDELLFGLHANGLGNNQIIVAQGPRPEGPSYSLDLPSTGAEIRLEGGAAQWPAPAVYLVSLDGREVSTHWGPRPELYAEDEGVGTDGTRVVRVPYVEAGAELLVKGLGPDGRRIERTVTVGAAGSTVVPWE